MDQDLSHWLHKHQGDIQHLWWSAAQASGRVPAGLLERLAQEDTIVTGSARLRILAALAADAPPPPQLLNALVRELSQVEWLALLNALRQAVFQFLLENAAPDGVISRWQALGQRIDQFALAIAEALDAQHNDLSASQTHWQTLYALAQELSTGIDLDLVLQKALSRCLQALAGERGAIWLFDWETERLNLQSAHDWPETSLKLQDMLAEWQRGHGAPILLPKAVPPDSALQTLVHDGAETVVAAPLLANGQFHGLLAIATTRPQGFNPQQLDVIRAVVNSVAASVGNAQVIRTLSQQSRELGLMLRHQQEESSKREAILTSIADGVVVNDRWGRIIMVNPAAEWILNASGQELLGRELKELFEHFTPDGRQDVLKAMAAVLSNPDIQISPEAAQTVLEIDTRTISARLSPVTTERGEFVGIVTIFRDITREIEADRAKSEFVSTVSHELRTPMTAIKGFTDLIFSGAVGEINDTQKRFLGIIKNNTDRLTALINDLLDISRVETGRVRFDPVPVRIGDIVQNVVDVLAPNAESKGHHLTCRVEAGLAEIMGDPNRLNQVFTNLVGNAINYTPTGGEIIIDVYGVVGALRADVRDNGIGIHPDDLNQVFERFYRADHPVVQESRGTGLGLSIVKMFVEMHGGRVWAESEPNKGSCFTVLLPLPTAQPEEEGLEDIWSKVAEPLERRQVLVADDDPDIAELVRLHLERTGYQVLVAGRGAQVLEMARQHHPSLIVLDILLPDVDGREVLKRLKAEPATADIPVVMLTVVADDGSAFDLGAAGYLTKPIDERELLDAARLAFSRRGRILVVEDDVDTVEMMRLALRRVGYNVDIAAEGYEALSLARRWRPQAIVLDLRLPGMDGYETLTHLKRSPATQGIPIIITSGHVADSEREEQRLKSLGVVSFLPKPFTVNQLVTIIDRATARAENHPLN